MGEFRFHKWIFSVKMIEKCTSNLVLTPLLKEQLWAKQADLAY